MHQAPPFFNFVVWREHNQYHVNVNIPLILETVALQLTEMLSSYPTAPIITISIFTLIFQIDLWIYFLLYLSWTYICVRSES